jgi:hypothetical protein
MVSWLLLVLAAACGQDDAQGDTDPVDTAAGTSSITSPPAEAGTTVATTPPTTGPEEWGDGPDQHEQYAVPDPSEDDASEAAEALPPPDECDPALDMLGDRNYFPLVEFPAEPVENPYLDGGAGTQVNVRNAKGQDFTFSVYAAEQGTVDRYIGSVSVCAEALGFEGGEFVGAPEDVRLDLILLEETNRLTGLSNSMLAARRDELSNAGDASSLAAVLISFGEDPADVLAQAAVRAETEVNDAVEAGRIPDAGDDVEELLRRLLKQPTAPFLLSGEPPDFGVLMREDPRGMVAVDLDIIEPDESQWIWFVIDPRLANNQSQGYRAKCTTYATAQLKSWSGGATMKFWRWLPDPYSYDLIGYQTNENPDPLQAALKPKKPHPLRTFDVLVTANESGTTVSVYGGWSVGTGGACPA